MENNPYDILGVYPAASKAEITKAVAVEMKQKQYSVDVIAKAQKSLMKAEERIIADYLRPILPTIKRFKYSDLSALEQAVPTLVLLSEFDGLDGAIAQAAAEESLEWLPLGSSTDVVTNDARRPVSANERSPLYSNANLNKQNTAVTI
jgi:hypothetical protein